MIRGLDFRVNLENPYGQVEIQDVTLGDLLILVDESDPQFNGYSVCPAN